MKKRLCICLSLIVIVCTLSGCQGTSDEIVDTQTEIETTDETLGMLKIESENENESESGSLLFQNVQKTVAEMVQAPERMVYEFDNPYVSDWFNPGIDAEIVLPTKDFMGVASVENLEFTEKDVQNLYNNLISDNSIYAEKSIVQACIDRVENYHKDQVADQQKLMGEYEAADELYKEGYELRLGVYEWLFWCNETLLQLLKDMLVQTEPDFSIKTIETPFGDKADCCWLLALDGDNVKSLFIVDSDAYLLTIPMCDMERYALIETWQDHFIDYNKAYASHGIIHNVSLTAPAYDYQERSPEYLAFQDIDGLDYKQVSDEALELLEKCGIKNQKITCIKDVTEYVIVYNEQGLGEQVEKRGLEIDTRTHYEDTNVLKSGIDYAEFAGGVKLLWLDDGLQSMSIHRYLNVETAVVQSVELLPFSRIEKIVKDFIGFGLEVETNSSLILDYSVDKIKLEYALMDSDNPKESVLVPVWNFYTVSQYGNNYSSIEEHEYEELYEYSRYELLLSINAIDGDIVDMFPIVQQ